MEGDGKWQIAFWVIAVLVVGSFSWTTLCAFNVDVKITKIKDEYILALHNIDKRLSRIEYSVGVKDDSTGIRV